jgi:hypothetical protein
MERAFRVASIPKTQKSSARELAWECLVTHGTLKDRFVRMKVSYQRKIEMSRDLIDRAFAKFRHEVKEDTIART